MKERKIKKPGRLFLTGLLCLLLLITIVPRTKSILELSARKQELQEERKALEKINKNHQKELNELKSPETIERIAREQLGMVKNGEKVVIEVIPEH